MSWTPPDPILMTTDPIGGVWTYTLDLCRALPDCPIALASMGRALRPDERRQVAGLANVELFESAFALEWMNQPWRDVAAAGDWLRAIAERVRPSIAHLNQFSHGALPWNMPSLVVGHSCVYSWSHAVRGERPSDGWLRYHAMVARGLRAAARVTAPSGWMLGELERIYGGFNRVGPIYNGSAPDRFPRVPKEDFVLSAGRLWDPAKNIAALDRVAAELPWPIYAAGDEIGPDGARVELRHVDRLGRLDRNALRSWMARAAIFALPARYEPFGLSILEAAQAGCALVIGDIPSLRENWEDAALFVPPDDAGALAETLRELIARPELRRALAGRARERAGRFTPERTAKAYLALYREMLASADGRRAVSAQREGHAGA
jgi:glycosyltransferase involved in cell wall biosynthesis